jgi:hypothetical protein
VAAHLALYKFTLKTSPPSRFNPNLKEPIPEKFTLAPLEQSKEWFTGAVCAEAQNLARTVGLDSHILLTDFSDFIVVQLMELPANMMTPTVCGSLRGFMTIYLFFLRRNSPSVSRRSLRVSLMWRPLSAMKVVLRYTALDIILTSF